MFVFIFSVCNRGCGPKWGNGEGGGTAKSKKRDVGLT